MNDKIDRADQCRGFECDNKYVINFKWKNTEHGPTNRTRYCKHCCNKAIRNLSGIRAGIVVSHRRV